MDAWRVWAVLGLAAGMVGAVILARVQSALFKATNQFDGILEPDAARARKQSRWGWGCIIAAFALQIVSVWTAP